MPGPIPFYGSRPDPNGRGTLVRDKNGREFLFTGPPVEGFDKYESVGGYTSPDAAAATAAVQDPRVAGTPHAAPERPRGPTFDELDRLGGEGSRPVPPQSSATAAFARSAAAGALDTAALPVTLPARAYRAAGGRGEALDTIADLRADEALQDATWLATGEDAGPYRERVAREREEFPNASAAGTELGASLPLAALGPAARGIERGIAGRISQRTAEERVRTLGRAYADALELGDGELAADLKRRIQKVQPYRGGADKRAAGVADLAEKDRLAAAANAAEEARRAQPEVLSAAQAERRRIDDWLTSQGREPIFTSEQKGLKLIGDAVMPGVPSGAREDAHRRQAEYVR